MTKQDARSMKDTGTCPCCKRALHPAEIDDLLADVTAAESLRGLSYPPEVALRIRESGARYGLHELRAAEAAEAVKLQETADVAVFSELTGNPRAAQFAARGRADSRF